MVIPLDPGIGEREIGKTAELSVGEVQRDVPGPPEQVAVGELELTEDALALAVTQTAGE